MLQIQKAISISKRKEKVQENSILCDYWICYMEMVSPDLWEGCWLSSGCSAITGLSLA